MCPCRSPDWFWSHFSLLLVPREHHSFLTHYCSVDWICSRHRCLEPGVHWRMFWDDLPTVIICIQVCLTVQGFYKMNLHRVYAFANNQLTWMETSNVKLALLVSQKRHAGSSLRERRLAELPLLFLQYFSLACFYNRGFLWGFYA